MRLTMTRAKTIALHFLLGTIAAFCLLGLYATFDAEEEARTEAYKQETIAAARKKVRLERIASDMRIQIAEAK